MEPSEFIPGLYRHYKGGLYNALMLVTHHETNLRYVVYVPYQHPESGVRLREYDHGDSPWNEQLMLGEPQMTSRFVPRFKRVRQ